MCGVYEYVSVCVCVCVCLLCARYLLRGLFGVVHGAHGAHLRRGVYQCVHVNNIKTTQKHQEHTNTSCATTSNNNSKKKIHVLATNTTRDEH